MRADAVRLKRPNDAPELQLSPLPPRKAVPTKAVAPPQRPQKPDAVIGFRVRRGVRGHIGHQHLVPHLTPVPAQIVHTHFHPAHDG